MDHKQDYQKMSLLNQIARYAEQVAVLEGELTKTKQELEESKKEKAK